MRIDVFTVFPELVGAFARPSRLDRASERGLLEVRTYDLRDGATEGGVVHRTMDVGSAVA